MGTAPDLHTASAQQMLHSWPRIRLSLTLENVEPLEYLAEADAEDLLLIQAKVPHLTPPQVVRALENLYDSIEALPVEIIYLFRSYDGLSQRRVLNELIQMYASSDSLVGPQQLSIAQLVTISVAICSSIPTVIDGLEDNATQVLSAEYFNMALSKSWTLLTTTEDRIALSLLMAYCLAYYWARPFHALGLLQSLHAVIGRFSFKQQNAS